MSDDVLGFLGDTPGTEEPTVEQPAAEPEATVEAQAEPEPAAKPPAAPEPAQAPLAALLDEREKRQAAEKRARELEERWAQAQQSAQPAPTDAEALEQRLYDQRLDMSRAVAEQKYGPEFVQSAHDWAFDKCASDPFFNAQIRSSRFPYEAAIQAYNREQIAAKVTPERLAAFEAWEAAQAQAQAHDPTPQQSAATPPRSLVNAPGTGLAGRRDTPPEDGAAFMAAIPR